MEKLSRAFYNRDDVVTISKELLGKVLATQLNGSVITSGIIVETEAYSGYNDKACHAYEGKRTPRTEVMYQEGGHAYIYLCYGIHHMFNVVTNKEGLADAVLIRAIEPLEGTKEMLLRRDQAKVSSKLTAGPGSLSKALGFDKSMTGTDLRGSNIWIEDRGIHYAKKEIISSPRVGVDYAGEDAKLPWRFRIKNSVWTSPAK